MKRTLIFLSFFLSLSCSKNPENFIEHLNGYWEIDEVVLSDGSKRDYNYNDTIDFLSVSDSLKGFRKKLKPNLDGSFSTSNDSEEFVLTIENDNLKIHYKTPYAQWYETVVDATADKLVIENQKKIRYVYKRYQPLDIN